MTFGGGSAPGRGVGGFSKHYLGEPKVATQTLTCRWTADRPALGAGGEGH